MRVFHCEVCGAELFFENSVCVTCGTAVGYSREQGTIVAVDADRPICANLNLCGCNWIADRLSPAAKNVHFEDTFADGTLAFDYRLKPGVVRSSNALALMRAVGLDV